MKRSRPGERLALTWLGALLLSASCHDYALFEAEPTLGAGSSSFAGDGASARAGKDGVGSSNGSQSGQSSGGSGEDAGAHSDAGSAGDGGVGQVGAGQGGESGEGVGGAPVGNELGPASVLGTVAIEAGGRTCAGTLQTNAWVLTAGHCIPADVDPGDVTVQFGSDLLNPREVVHAAEIVRFGKPEEFRDLALLRLEHAFAIDDARFGYLQQYYPLVPDELWKTRLYCLGWDMSPSEGQATTTQSGYLEVGDLEPGTVPTVGAGLTLWLKNNTTDGQPEMGRVTQASDEGGGCFVQIDNKEWFLVAVQLESPTLDRGGQPNGYLWSRAASLTDSATRHWLLRTMLGTASVPEIAPSRGVSAVAAPEGDIVLLWLDETGRLRRRRLEDAGSGEDLGQPHGVEFVSQRPGGAFFASDLVVVAYGNDQQLWYRRIGTTTTNWAPVESAVSPTTSAGLVAVDGVVHLFALGGAAEMRQATYEGSSWQQWIDLGGICKGAPWASSWGPGRIDFMVRSPNANGVWQRGFQNGYGWLDWTYTGGTSPSDPLIIDSGGVQVEMFRQDDVGNLRLIWNNYRWLSEWLDPGIPIGQYLAGVSAKKGSYDVFASDGVSLTHLWWPR